VQALVAAAPEPFRPAIVAVAARPATVVLMNSSGMQTYTTTVGQVYQNSPAHVRREMTSHDPPPSPFHIEHEYDQPEDPDHCYNTHCMTSHNDFTVSTQHKDYTISSDFASVEVKY
jgi:hypothetical protein